MKEHKKNNWLWVGLAVFCVAIIGLSIGIAVKLMRDGTGGDEYSVDMEEMEAGYKVDDLAAEILDKTENDINYTLDDADEDFTQLIENSNGDEKVYAITSYAYFVFDQTGDIKKAAGIMEEAIDSVRDGLKAGYYNSIGILYEEAEMYDQSAKYYNMASKLYAERDALWDGE